MEMNYQKALNILGLSDNYTDEELKKAYRKLAKKYHPDVNSDKIDAKQREEKLKEINAAKEYLETYKKDDKQRDKNNEKDNEDPIYTNIEKYKENTILKMSQMISFDQTRKLNSYINDYQYCQKQINKLMNLIVLYDNIFKAISNINQIDYYFNTFKQKVSGVYDEIKKQYYQENNILEADVTEQLNYDCEIKDFCNQLILINVKDKQRKEAQLISRLEKEISNYKYIPLYDEIHLLIEKCISKTLNDIKNNNFQNTEQMIKQMHKEINNLFKRYAILKARLIKIEHKLKKNNNELLNKIFNDIKKTCGKIDLEQSEMFLDELESKITEKQAKNNNPIENIKETKSNLKAIRNQIMSNFKSKKQENNGTKKKK